MDTVIVASSQFYSHYPKRIPQGTVNAEAVLIRLDSEWDGLTVRIHWLNVASNVERKPLLERDQPNTIPWEVLTDLGELRMGLVGLDGETVIKPTIWLTYGYVSDGVDPESGSDPQPPTPSWEQQMVAQATSAANAAKAAKETADRLQAAAEAGEFNGDPGPAGPPGKSPIIRNGTWWIWDNDSQDYKDTGVVASGGGGGGVSSYNDLADRPRIGGVLLEGNKTAQDLGLQPKGDYATTSSKLSNPYFLTFAGAVEATYDGSKAVTVTIPTIAGPAGVSPTVSTEEIDGGTRVTFAFKDGSETVDILDGNTPNLQIGTVETLEPGSNATATITGTPENPLINLGIPRGQNGKTPVKGIDYFTDEEIQAIASQAAALVPGGGGLELIDEVDITPSEKSITFDLKEIGKTTYLIEVSCPKTENGTKLVYQIGNSGTTTLSARLTSTYASNAFFFVALIDDNLHGFAASDDGWADGSRIYPVIHNPRITTGQTKLVISLYPYVSGEEKFHIKIFGK